MDETQAAAYLAGMIDGEGHVSPRVNRSVSVSSTDWELIEAVVRCCELLGLHQTVQQAATKPPRKQAWAVMITGKASLEKIQEVVPIQCQRKVAALDFAIKDYKQKPRPPREWVEEKYWGEGMTLQQVAEAWGVKNSVSAHCWMKYYDIPRRSPNEHQRKHPMPSEEWLRQKYEIEGLTQPAIARLAGAPHAATVHGWMKHYGIPTRPRGRRKVML